MNSCFASRSRFSRFIFVKFPVTMASARDSWSFHGVFQNDTLHSMGVSCLRIRNELVRHATLRERCVTSNYGVVRL